MKPIFALLLGLNAFVLHAQDVLKTWEIPPYTVQLLRHEQAEHTSGYDLVSNKKKNYMKTYHITKDEVGFLQLSYHQVSKDSCIVSFLEAAPNRPKDGHVANKIQLNLCNLTKQIKAVNKPSWNAADIKSAQIQPLDSSFVNYYNPHTPIKVKDYNDGKPMPLHPKNITGFLLFFGSSYILAPYHEDDFKGQFTPHFKVRLEGDFSQPKEILLYWERFLVDGYIYSSGGQNNTPFFNSFWESNLKLWEMEQNRPAQQE